MAGHGLACRVDQHHLATPTADAGLGEAGVIVGEDGFEVDFALEALFRGLDDGNGAVDLLLGRHEQRAVLERPAVVLDVGDLKTIGVEFLGESDESLQPVEIQAVDDQVYREGERVAPEEGHEGQLEGVRAGPGDLVGGGFVDVLKAELKMFEAGVDQLGEARLGKADARGDHVDVEAGVAGGPGELGQVFSREWFSAGEVDVKDAELGCLTEDAPPVVRAQLRLDALHFERIGAIEAVQRAAVGDLRDERKGFGAGRALFLARHHSRGPSCSTLGARELRRGRDGQWRLHRLRFSPPHAAPCA